MKNKRIAQSREEVKIYEAYYKPSFNPARFVKSVLGVLLFGHSSVAHSYVSVRKRSLK